MASHSVGPRRIEHLGVATQGLLGPYLGYAPLPPARLYSEEELELLLQPGGPLGMS